MALDVIIAVHKFLFDNGRGVRSWHVLGATAGVLEVWLDPPHTASLRARTIREGWELPKGLDIMTSSGTPVTCRRHITSQAPATRSRGRRIFQTLAKSRRKGTEEGIRKTRMKLLQSGNKLFQNIRPADTSTNWLSGHKIKGLSSAIIEPEDIIESGFAVIRAGSWGEERCRWTYT